MRASNARNASNASNAEVAAIAGLAAVCNRADYCVDDGADDWANFGANYQRCGGRTHA
jgi:hypothetical protein